MLQPKATALTLVTIKLEVTDALERPILLAYASVAIIGIVIYFLIVLFLFLIL